MFPASDGVRLAGWYAPGRNGAAIVLVHGGGGDRQSAVRHARMLHAAGYGVLLYDARGRGESGGHENAFGWNWDRDVRGAVDFLEADGVRHIGLLGLSTGAEAVVTEAASDPRVAAVVSDGLQGRTPGDASHLDLGNRISIQPAFVVLAAEIQAVRGEHQPAPLIDLVHRVAATRPLLLIGTESFERQLDRAYVKGTDAELWQLPGTAHTQGLATRPAAYAARVLAVFDNALRPR
jgi:pimeloyl-ACP methyl ester carboxylesterase